MNIDREEFLKKLATIGQTLFANDHVSFMLIAEYVRVCSKEFDLTEDEIKVLLYDIFPFS